MGATNSTLHYNLSQFISTDKPAWLQDYNGDMQKIDVGINGALTAAESAQNSADSASSGVSSLGDAVSALTTTVSGHTSDITDLSGDVNTIESLIGNGTPTAGDHTIIGAVNENTASIAALRTNRLIASAPSGQTGASQAAILENYFDALSDSEKQNSFIEFGGYMLRCISLDSKIFSFFQTGISSTYLFGTTINLTAHTVAQLVNATNSNLSTASSSTTMNLYTL